MHKNGEAPCFNDSIHDIRLNHFYNYIEKNGFSIKDKNKLKDLNDFYVYSYDKYKIIIDLNSVSPKFIPGHSHAQVASFELSNKDCVIFNNGGISTYENNKIREFERSSKS